MNFQMYILWFCAYISNRDMSFESWAVTVGHPAFAFRGFRAVASAVWSSLPAGTHDASSALTFRRLKTHCFEQAFGFPSDSPKCLRFGHWLTLCTVNIYLLSYLLTYLLTYLLIYWLTDCLTDWQTDRQTNTRCVITCPIVCYSNVVIRLSLNTM